MNEKMAGWGLDEKEIVIFDMDGVLISTKEMCLCSYRAVLDEFYGEEFRKERFPDELLGTFVEIPLALRLAENGISDGDIERILPRYYEFNEKFEHLNRRVLASAREVRRLRDEVGKPLYMASLKAEVPGRKIFAQIGLEDCFDLVQFRTEAGTKEDVLRTILPRIGKDATVENCIYIGDMPYDREASAKVGIDYVDISEILGFSPNFAEGWE